MLWAVLVGVCGCNTPQTFEDVSSGAVYRDYVGAQYRLRVAMHISGVTAPPGYEKRVDYYVVNPAAPSWSGPELITRATLAAGTMVTVESLRRCTNCPFEEVVEARIRVFNHEPEFDRPIHIHLKYLAPDYAVKQPASNDSPPHLETRLQGRR